MFTRRTIMKTTHLPPVQSLCSLQRERATQLVGFRGSTSPPAQKGFFRAPVLITGASEAVLIDGGFTYSDGRAVADAIEATGKSSPPSISAKPRPGLLLQPPSQLRKLSPKLG